MAYNKIDWEIISYKFKRVKDCAEEWGISKRRVGVDTQPTAEFRIKFAKEIQDAFERVGVETPTYCSNGVTLTLNKVLLSFLKQSQANQDKYLCQKH